MKSAPRNLSEIAELVGVTRSAVSLAINNSPQVSDALKKKINKVISESGFTPRKYTKKKGLKSEFGTHSQKELSKCGKIVFIRYISEDEDSVNLELENACLKQLNHHGLDFDVLSVEAILEMPRLLDIFAGVIYYFDPIGLTIPIEKKCVQIFGFSPLPPGRDRITTNDEQIATLALNYLNSSGVKNMVMVYRDDMVINNWHPRVKHFQHLVANKGLNYIDFMYTRGESDFDNRLKKIIKEAGPDTGFFTFSDICAFKLYMQLNASGNWNNHFKRRVVCGDTTQFLKRFWPRNFLIEINLEQLAIRAVDRLVEKLRTDDSLGVTLMLEAQGITQPE